MIRTVVNAIKYAFRQTIVPYVLIFCITALSHSAVCCGQFRGEDEASQLKSAEWMISSIRYVAIPQFSRTIATQPHPPLRYILAMPGIILFPHSEFGLRFVAILISFYMTYQVIKLGQDLGGNVVGFTSGALIACSPVYNWTSTAFAWSLTVTMLIHSVRLLRSNSLDIQTPSGEKTFTLVHIFVAVAFLINTGNILFFVSTLLVYFIHNSRRLHALVRLSWPFILFYGLYYAFFLIVIPYVGAEFLNLTVPFGQLNQNLTRAEWSYLNYTSFLDNIKGINGYFIPYVSWVVLICALSYLIRYERVIAIWISIFVAAWSFYITSGTHQYFLLVFITIFPFGVKFICDKLGAKRFVILSIVIGIAISSWNYQLFIKPYGTNDPNYPTSLLIWGHATISRVHNISQPFDELANDIDELLTENKFFVHDISGSFTIFYYPSTKQKYAGQFGSDKYQYEYHLARDCYNTVGRFDDVSVIVTFKHLCPEQVEKHITYPKSNINLYLLNDVR